MSSVTDIVGTVDNPSPAYGSIAEGGLTLLISNVLRLVFVVAGLFALVNLVLAGFQFMSAGGDSKAIEKAWGKIWQSFLGLIIVVGSFALTALFGYLIFGDAGYIFNPKIYGP